MSATADAPPPQCATCGAVLAGPFCARCGQRVLEGRHTLRSMVAGALGRVFNLERGIGRTMLGLTVAPGGVVRDYLAGRTVPYTHPFGYLLIAFAVNALLLGLMGGTGGAGPANRLFSLLLVPFVAAVSWLLFLPARLHYAEHLILCMFLIGHMALMFGVAQVLAVPVPMPARATLAVAVLAVAFGYFAWAYSRIFATRPLLAAAGSIAAVLGGAALWMVVVAAIVRVAAGLR